MFVKPSSSAIPIVNPNASPSPAPSEASSPTTARASIKKDPSQRHCRNIHIYGSCKFEGKGCVYYHPPRPDSPSPSNNNPSRTLSPGAVLSAQHVNAPVFIPKSMSSIELSQPENEENPERTSPPNLQEYEFDPYDPTPSNIQYELNESPSAVDLSGFSGLAVTTPQEFETGGNLDAFYPTSNFPRQPLNYHLYTAPMSHAANLDSSHKHGFFISDSIREDLQRRSEVMHAACPPGISLPEELHVYHSLVPLENTVAERRKSFGNWYSTVYRATSSADGTMYVLRRIENFRLLHEVAFAAIESWSHLQHPNIVTVREAFTTRAFNDQSLVVAYDYHPTAVTLFEAHIKPKPPAFRNGRMQPQIMQIPERVMWTYIVQIANAMKAVHDLGMAVRVLDATRVLLTGKNRVRINCCGIIDVLGFDGRQGIRHDAAIHQQEDMVHFGKLVISLCCNNLSAMNNLPKALETVTRNYSPDLKNVALFLISKPGPHKVIGQLFDMIGSRLLTEMDAMQSYADRLESDLTRELENGRLVRLLCKFGFINERPEFDRDPRWSETGDRYIIKLFRDYVFHQVDENGNPVVNLTHVLTCLNKLDAGVDERIMLVSRDEQSCLVVSYKEVRTCIEAAFGDLSRGIGR